MRPEGGRRNSVLGCAGLIAYGCLVNAWGLGGDHVAECTIAFLLGGLGCPVAWAMYFFVVPQLRAKGETKRSRLVARSHLLPNIYDL